LIENDEGNVLIDSGSIFDEEAIKAEIDSITDGDGVSVIILTHSDIPHSANVMALDDYWDNEIEIMSAVLHPYIHGLKAWGDGSRKIFVDRDMEVLNRDFRAIEAILADRSHSNWVYDYSTKVLFTADGFGNYHSPGQCNFTSNDYPDGITTECIKQFHREKLPWLQFVRTEQLQERFEAFFEPLDLNCIAPVHGNPIHGSHVDEYVDRLLRSVTEMYEEYVPPEQA